MSEWTSPERALDYLSRAGAVPHPAEGEAALHHLEDARKHVLYEEVFALLEPGGAFLNLDRVASPTPALRHRFLAAMSHEVAVGHEPHDDAPSDQPLDVETQLEWLREIGFADVDCYWKWLELALLGGVKPAG